MNAVLFADDDQGIRELNARVLKARGFTCSTAADGEEALAKLEPAPIRFEATEIWSGPAVTLGDREFA